MRSALGLSDQPWVHRFMQAVGMEEVSMTFPTAATHEIVLEANQEASIGPDSTTITSMAPEETAHRLDWAQEAPGLTRPNGWIDVQNETLASLVAEYNRHNSRQMKFADAATAQLRIGGKFRVTDLDAFLDALAVTDGIKVIRRDQGPHGEMIMTLAGADTDPDAVRNPSRPHVSR